ncbi:hypothetical protein B0G69_3921 [Paraburkholderia sp. RAU2J]|uniref:hypothetical protein n=1 Tax=Paraburkholderia sp. RAU2J TaxID=1938810 RepID=UPI000EB4A050|nr:hypothetical protein [Paraburkholderia sp. RAU2J]RKT20602.1 hypothetical protein B0G69_3921 [Paraburkholderia sp. RAU2J]
MNRPLALIQGRLAQPNARLLRGLPPPYGVYRGPVRPATRRRPQPAFQDTERRLSPQEPHTWFAPGQKFRFFYKSPPQRDYSSRLDAELAEARNYLEMDKARERSSHLDHVLGVTLFVACSIVLAWLLTSNAARDAGKLATVTIAEPAVTTPGASVVVRPRASGKSAQPVAELMPSVPQIAPSPANLASAGGRRNEPKPSLQAKLQATPTLSAQHAEPPPAALASTDGTASSHAVKVNARIKSAATTPTNTQLPAADPIETLADDYQSPSRSPRPAIPPAISAQPEQIARSPAADATVQATLRDWATQQRHAHVTARTNTNTAYVANVNPLGPRDPDWNTHLTQRQITDNPSAFDPPNTQN